MWIKNLTKKRSKFYLQACIHSTIPVMSDCIMLKHPKWLFLREIGKLSWITKGRRNLPRKSSFFKSNHLSISQLICFAIIQSAFAIFHFFHFFLCWDEISLIWYLVFPSIRQLRQRVVQQVSGQKNIIMTQCTGRRNFMRQYNFLNIFYIIFL